jgi:hypothetical protein
VGFFCFYTLTRSRGGRGGGGGAGGGGGMKGFKFISDPMHCNLQTIKMTCLNACLLDSRRIFPLQTHSENS